MRLMRLMPVSVCGWGVLSLSLCPGFCIVSVIHSFPYFYFFQFHPSPTHCKPLESLSVFGWLFILREEGQTCAECVRRWHVASPQCIVDCLPSVSRVVDSV